jgi:hypothetical protein
MSATRWQQGLLCLALIALIAAPLWAQFTYYGNQTVPIPGVDAYGNWSTPLGSNIVCRAYYDPTNGITFVAGSGYVTNLYGNQTSFVNRGIAISDALSGDALTATTDFEYIARPRARNLSRALLLAVYNPLRLPQE